MSMVQFSPVCRIASKMHFQVHVEEKVKHEIFSHQNQMTIIKKWPTVQPNDH
uniref:Uncharacterized protein n=1 Tax=Anguilla anguilla TaxID=7936 RepID=A0A0E9XB51_ANGAN